MKQVIAGLALLATGIAIGLFLNTRRAPTLATPPPDPNAQLAAQAPQGEEVKPVYPTEGVTPDPLAQRYCEAMHAEIETRRAACCGGTPGLVFTADCVRMLSAAVQEHALVIDAAGVDRCLTDWRAALADCQWVGALPPPLPGSCRNLLAGRLAAGKRCRSSLECIAPLRCHGVGPTTPGRCAPTRRVGEPCGLAVDALAVFARVDEVGETHPECEGVCRRRHCEPPLKGGDACTLSLECGADMHCAHDKCVAGRYVRVGDACTGADCEPNARCVNGVCAIPKPTGAACDSEFECRGGCLKPDGGARGSCGPRCGVR